MGHANNIITAPVDVQGDLAYLFGVDSGDLGTIINNAFINKWAKYKPVRSSAIKLVSNPANPELDDWAKANYGFDLQSGSAPVDEDIVALFSRMAAGTANWQYLKPRGIGAGHNNELYRALDFVDPNNPTTNGYHHNAPAPYTLDQPARPSVFGPKILALNEDNNAEITIDKFTSSLFDDVASMDDVYVYLLFKKVGDATPTIITPIRGVTPASYLNTSYLTFQANFPSNGTYQYFAVATAWDSTSGDDPDAFTWVALPDTWNSVELNDQNHILDLRYNEEDMDMSFAASINSSGLLSLQSDVQEFNVELGAEAVDVVLHLELTYRASAQYPHEILHTENINGYDLIHGDEPGHYIPISRSINASDVHDLYGADALSYIYVRLYYEYKASGDTYVYNRYFDFLDPEWKGLSHSYALLNDVPYVPLQDILDIMP